MGRLGDEFRGRMKAEASEPESDPGYQDSVAQSYQDDTEQQRRDKISAALGDHYRDRRKRLEEAAKRATKSDAKPRTSDGIIGVRG